MMGLLPAYKGYQAKVEYSTEDSLLVGEVLGVADSLNFHAESVHEVESMFHQCIDDYLEFCKEVGKVPEKGYRGSFNIRIAPELHRKADAMAAEQGLSLNQFVANALEHEVNGKFATTMSLLLPPKKVEYFVDDVSAQSGTSILQISGKDVGRWSILPA